MVLGGVVLKIWLHTSGLSFRNTLFTRDPLNFKLLSRRNRKELQPQISRVFISQKYLPTHQNKENPRCWVDSCGELAWNDPNIFDFNQSDKKTIKNNLHLKPLQNQNWTCFVHTVSQNLYHDQVVVFSKTKMQVSLNTEKGFYQNTNSRYKFIEIMHLTHHNMKIWDHIYMHHINTQLLISNYRTLCVNGCNTGNVVHVKLCFHYFIPWNV